MAPLEFFDPVERTPAIVPDPSQRAVVEAADDADLLVIGAPGSGKTTTLVETVAERILGRGWEPRHVLALTVARGAATVLRDRLSRRVNTTTPGPLARSVNSLAFDIASREARNLGAPPPRLLTGGEQDTDFSDLLRGESAQESQAWPEPLTAPVRGTRGFRSELRELWMRAVEAGVSPRRLVELGREHAHPEWVAAGRFFERYRAAAALGRGDQLDSVELIQFATAALARGAAGEVAAPLRLVLVEDVHEAPASAVTFLAALASRGVHVIAFGNPDVQTSAFRGVEPDLASRLAGALRLPAMRRIVLERVHRHGPGIRDLVQHVTQHIGTAGIVGHRTAQAVATTHDLDPAVVLLSNGAARQTRALARHIRELTLLHRIPYESIAIVVRSGASAEALARDLRAVGVPTHTSAAGLPLRARPAAHALLTVVGVGCGRITLGPRECESMLLGPYGGLDRIGLRRLRLALRAEELAGGGHRAADDLVVEALAAPGRLATVRGPSARAAERLAGILQDIRDAFGAGGGIESLLWHAWKASGLASRLEGMATRDGIAAAEADRDLDAVGAVFTAAARFVERRPSAPATVFLDDALAADVPEDTLAPRAASQSVLVTTPSGAVGMEVDAVLVAGLQDGLWPNLRPRGSLLHADQLLDVLSGLSGSVVDERRRVLDDELRMFALALSRARQQVVLAVLENEDDAPSAFLRLLPDLPHLDGSGAVPRTLTGMAGLLRRRLTSLDADASTRRHAASGLAQLAAADVVGADPDDWLGLEQPSTDDPLFTAEEEVPVSPSRLDALETSPLDWFIDDISEGTGSLAAGVGTIIHWAMQMTDEPDLDAVWHAVMERWDELFFESPWLERKERAAAHRLAIGVTEYLADARRSGVQRLAAEERFTLRQGRAVVHGFVDRLEQDAEGRIVIVDLKTGRPITNQEQIDGHPQLGAYQLAYRAGAFDEVLKSFAGGRAGGAKLLFVREGVGGKHYREAVQAALDDTAAAVFCDRIDAAVRILSATSFSGPRAVSDHGTLSEAERRLRRVAEIVHD